MAAGSDLSKETAPPVREVRWERMFPDELEEAFQRCPLVYFTYGLCEPHGPHNAVGLDTLKAHAIACSAARAHGGIVAPPDAWHIHEMGGYAVWAHTAVGQVERTWLTSVPPWHHFKTILYQVRAADSIGFHGAILLTGHYGPNWEDLKTLMGLLQPHVGVRLYSLPDFEVNRPGFDGDNRSGGDHAGKVETSLLWALEPDCVDPSRLPAAGSPGPHFAMAADEVRELGGIGKRLLADYVREKPIRRLQTFAEVESLWDRVVKPQLPTFRTMQELFEGQSPPPEDSIWRRNWRVMGH